MLPATTVNGCVENRKLVDGVRVACAADLRGLFHTIRAESELEIHYCTTSSTGRRRRLCKNNNKMLRRRRRRMSSGTLYYSPRRRPFCASLSVHSFRSRCAVVHALHRSHFPTFFFLQSFHRRLFHFFISLLGSYSFFCFGAFFFLFYYSKDNIIYRFLYFYLRFSELGRRIRHRHNDRLSCAQMISHWPLTTVIPFIFIYFFFTFFFLSLICARDWDGYFGLRTFTIKRSFQVRHERPFLLSQNNIRFGMHNHCMRLQQVLFNNNIEVQYRSVFGIRKYQSC